MVAQRIGLFEEGEILAGQAVVHQILVHAGVERAAIVEVERQIAVEVVALGGGDLAGGHRVIMFAAFGLDEDRVGADGEDRPHRQHIAAHDVAQGGDERPVALEAFVPQPEHRREFGANIHLVDRGVELNPRKAPREIPRIAREQLGKIGVLEVADPVGHTEMAEVGDRHDPPPAQLAERLVGERPVVMPVAQQRLE